MAESKARSNGHAVHALRIGSRAQSFHLSTSQLADASYQFNQWLSGLARTIKLHLVHVNCHATRSIAPIAWRNHLPAKRKISTLPVSAQATPLGKYVYPGRSRNTVTNTGSPNVGYDGNSRSWLICSSMPVNISPVTSISTSWNQVGQVSRNLRSWNSWLRGYRKTPV